MSIISNINRIADALDDIRELFRRYVEGQGIQVPPRGPLNPPEPGALNYYDPIMEGRLEARANAMMVEGRFQDFSDAYDEAIKEEAKGRR